MRSRRLVILGLETRNRGRYEGLIAGMLAALRPFTATLSWAVAALIVALNVLLLGVTFGVG